MSRCILIHQLLLFRGWQAPPLFCLSPAPFPFKRRLVVIVGAWRCCPSKDFLWGAVHHAAGQRELSVGRCISIVAFPLVCAVLPRVCGIATKPPASIADKNRPGAVDLSEVTVKVIHVECPPVGAWFVKPFALCVAFQRKDVERNVNLLAFRPAVDELAEFSRF